MTTTGTRAEDQAKAQAESIVAYVAALDVNYERLEELRDTDADALSGEELAELAELEEAAGECRDYDDARERLQEDPLSVEYRSGWQSVGETLEASEFMILLCTGGPAVRIVGELDDNLEPSRAWIEYQDWGTPWTQAFNVIKQSTLLTYCQQFYYGG